MAAFVVIPVIKDIQVDIGKKLAGGIADGESGLSIASHADDLFTQIEHESVLDIAQGMVDHPVPIFHSYFFTIHSIDILIYRFSNPGETLKNFFIGRNERNIKILSQSNKFAIVRRAITGIHKLQNLN